MKWKTFLNAPQRLTIINLIKTMTNRLTSFCVELLARFHCHKYVLFFNRPTLMRKKKKKRDDINIDTHTSTHPHPHTYIHTYIHMSRLAPVEINRTVHLLYPHKCHLIIMWSLHTLVRCPHKQTDHKLSLFQIFFVSLFLGGAKPQLSIKHKVNSPLLVLGLLPQDYKLIQKDF